MSDLGLYEEVYRRLWTKLKLSVHRLILGLLVGIASAAIVYTMGEPLSCLVALVLGLTVYYASGIVAEKSLGSTVSRRDAYVAGIFSYFASWYIGYIMFVVILG